jgi:hypothetical protein
MLILVLVTNGNENKRQVYILARQTHSKYGRSIKMDQV